MASQKCFDAALTRHIFIAPSYVNEAGAMDSHLPGGRLRDFIYFCPDFQARNLYVPKEAVPLDVIRKHIFGYCLPGASALGIRGHQGASGSCFPRFRGHQGHLTGHQGFQNFGFVDPWPGELGVFKI